MLETPKSIDDQPWQPGDFRARWFYRCEACQAVYTSLSEGALRAWYRSHCDEHLLQWRSDPQGEAQSA